MAEFGQGERGEAEMEVETVAEAGLSGGGVEAGGAAAVVGEFSNEGGEIHLFVVIDDGIGDAGEGEAGLGPASAEFAILGGAEADVEAAEAAKRFGGEGEVVGWQEEFGAGAGAIVTG